MIMKIIQKTKLMMKTIYNIKKHEKIFCKLYNNFTAELAHVFNSKSTHHIPEIKSKDVIQIIWNK